ncbi:MAG: hypothetical protein ACRD0A_17860, partial [Acidimicrobiales bacterium]
MFVEWRGAVENPPPAGAHELQGLDPETVTEIGEVLAGTRPGRTTDLAADGQRAIELAVDCSQKREQSTEHSIGVGLG